MLRIMQRWFGRSTPQATSKPAADTAVLLVRVPPQPAPEQPALTPLDQASSSAASTPAATLPPVPRTPPASDHASPAAVPPSETHGAVAADSAAAQAVIAANPAVAERASLPLSALGVISDRLLQKLQRAGLRSCDALLRVDPAALVQQIGAPSNATVKIRRYQRAIRFSQRFSSMTPHEALLLFAAHRRSPTGLATENAGILRRDLERLLLSSRGQKLAAGRPAPALQEVRQWIAEAKVLQERKNRALRAADRDSELPRIAPARKSFG